MCGRDYDFSEELAYSEYMEDVAREKARGF
jgi:hypothetical protein